MKAARLHGPKDVRIEEVPEPVAAEGEVLIRVRAVSICASDCRMYWDGHAGGVTPDHPMIQGHEFAGDIAGRGPGVGGPPVGTRVAVEPSWHCGECDMCEAGYPNVCRNIQFPSFPNRDGALAEYIACPANAICEIPDHVSYTEAALVEPLGVGMHAARLADPKPGDRVVILGMGAIGVSVLMSCKLRGVEQVAASEPVEGRRQWARDLGADPVVASARELIEAERETEVIIECAGEATAVEEALLLAKPEGKVVVVGIPHPERISFDACVPRRHELTMIFARRSRNTLEEAVGLVASGRIDLKVLPIRKFTLEQAADAIETTAARPGDMLRAVVEP
ncbi:MAG TPA: alcohol dehydrogenase catalytic domain-containing protein [Armatimonadota bacterium]|nr:alcohol dehydrogenase catalytic domain-containing protein [Armatimonadota bacterium]